MKTSNIVLILLGIFLFLFIVIMVVTFWMYQAVPDTLITAVLGSSGLEALILGLIKIVKVKNLRDEEEDEEE